MFSCYLRVYSSNSSSALFCFELFVPNSIQTSLFFVTKVCPFKFNGQDFVSIELVSVCMCVYCLEPGWDIFLFRLNVTHNEQLFTDTPQSPLFLSSSPTLSLSFPFYCISPHIFSVTLPLSPLFYPSLAFTLLLSHPPVLLLFLGLINLMLNLEAFLLCQKDITGSQRGSNVFLDEGMNLLNVLPALSLSKGKCRLILLHLHWTIRPNLLLRLDTAA